MRWMAFICLNCVSSEPALPCLQRDVDALMRDPEYGWVRSEGMRLLGLKEEFFRSSWAMTGDLLRPAVSAFLHVCQRRRCLTDLNDAMTSMKAHGKALPEGMTDRLLVAINRLATREFAAFVVS